MNTYRPAGAAAVAGYRHHSDHGFCTVCGGVWPCARAERDSVPPAIPVPRLVTLPGARTAS
jgi:hypothetical protein